MPDEPDAVTIYHSPACSTSRKVPRVAGPGGVRLCRPVERVFEMLPAP